MDLEVCGLAGPALVSLTLVVSARKSRPTMLAKEGFSMLIRGQQSVLWMDIDRSLRHHRY